MFVNMLRKSLFGVATLGLLMLSGPAAAEYALNLTQGVTPISRDVYELHMLILWIVTAIGAVVFSVLIWSIVHHRKSKGAVAAQFHHSTTAEIAWTIIPICILIAMAVPATRLLIKMEATGDADLTIKVTGYQWKWHYQYIEDDFGFFSVLSTERVGFNKNEGYTDSDPEDVENYLLDVDKRIVVPTNTKIRILTTAADVIHSWWVPALGWKRDAIPGFINDNWAIIEEAGVYRGQCTELCGKDHGYMPIVLEAVSPEEYATWAGEQKLAAAAAAGDSNKTFSLEELMTKGEAVYGTQCAACHQANGKGIPGAFPALEASPIATGDVAGHLDIVINGKVGSAMAAFGQQLSDADLAAVITYERNAWGNDTGDLVQPADVKAAR